MAQNDFHSFFLFVASSIIFCFSFLILSCSLHYCSMYSGKGKDLKDFFRPMTRLRVEANKVLYALISRTCSCACARTLTTT
jgi:hypothetical protein